MAVQIGRQGGEFIADVRETLGAEDVFRIEAAIEEDPEARAIVVNLKDAREKQGLALWLLMLAARGRPDRYRVRGLTLADSRFLALLDLEDQGGHAG